MKKNFKDQFDNLKEILKSNIDTISALIKQSNQLSEVIATLENQKDCESIKRNLNVVRSEIAASIDKLIDQTRQLFETYDELIEEVFNK